MKNSASFKSSLQYLLLLAELFLLVFGGVSINLSTCDRNEQLPALEKHEQVKQEPVDPFQDRQAYHLTSV